MGTFKGIMKMLLPLSEKFMNYKNVHFIIAGDGTLFKDVERWLVSKQYKTFLKVLEVFEWLNFP